MTQASVRDMSKEHYGIPQELDEGEEVALEVEQVVCLDYSIVGAVRDMILTSKLSDSFEGTRKANDT